MALAIVGLGTGSIQAQPAGAPSAAPTASASEARAPADPLERCVAAHGQARTAREAGRLLDERPALAVCAERGCPIALRAECAEWLAEAQRQAPTIVLSAGSASGDEVQARVFMDGRLLRDKLDGSAIEVPPGPHLFRFELEGHPPLEVRAVIGLGQKNRAIRAVIAEPEAARPASALRPERPTKPVKTERRIPPESVVLGGIAIAGAAAASSFLAKGLVERERAWDECRPNCDDARVASIRRWFILADVAGTSAALAGGASVFLYFAKDPVPVANGFTLGIHGRF